MLNIRVNGQLIQKYYDREGRTFVEGRRGSKYSLVLSNHDSVKRKAVISVDGVNILTGDQTWTKGYVLEPFGTVEIPGWRIDKQKAAEFYFSDARGAYAGSGNSGVIGVKYFDEVVTHTINNWPAHNTVYTASVGAFGSAGPGSKSGFRGSALSPSISVWEVDQTQIGNNLGTGWGNETQFNTHKDYSQFNPYESYTEIVYYDDAKGLEKRGISVKRLNSFPNPFPGSTPGSGDFGCKPPS